VLQLFNEKQFVGHYRLYVGQEATGAAIMALLDGRDRIATTHRNHGHVLARGADPLWFDIVASIISRRDRRPWSYRPILPALA
jgi:TPP-dependent pyruvate/acetoin dehydrogenase alpha subunit